MNVAPTATDNSQFGDFISAGPVQSQDDGFGDFAVTPNSG